MSAVNAQGTDAGGGGKSRSRRYELTCWSSEAATGLKVRQIGDTVTETRTRFPGPPLLEHIVSADGKSVLFAGGRDEKVIPVICRSATTFAMRP